ncbi:redoxin domain-containing protein [Singulisphaera acidiphila]|uniref:Peroxiredoxin n=2 Tax=Singulisphaera acidiphila TaxID=466153 RepID=L0DGP5_SINAD|nr:redoxin domain-containing protein [Singulisphaera acidiphila]AGA27978.1 Peroxiredoxin [Singulisphaera acidiphila DSM 18658]
MLTQGRSILPCLGVCLVVVAGLASVAWGESPPEVSFRLQDFRGAWHASDEVRDRKLIVLAFLGVDCPVANRYAPTLAELAGEFGPQGVAFFAVDANRQDGLTAMGRFADVNKLSFPFLKDAGNVLADRLGVERTPEVVVLDEARKVRYRGRVDDQFTQAAHRPSPTRRDLAVALGELLAGREVSTPTTAAVGCRIGRARPPGKGSVTYSGQVARVLRDRCVVCHRPGEIAPFALTSYEEAAGWADSIAEVVREGRMPPWHASPDHGKFRNEARLTDEEKAAIAAWAADGAPRGNPVEPPAPSPHAAGWRIPEPDLVVELPRAVEVPASGVLPYQNFTIDLKLDHDIWVKASQVRPQNPAVVHHLVVYALPPGQSSGNPLDHDIIAMYSPGMPPRILPEGTAKVIPAGAKLLVQVHYTPRGTPQTDRSRIGLSFADRATVRKRMTSAIAINYEFRIPPKTADYPATAEHRFNQDYILYALLPHMHLRGKSFRYEAEYPDGRREVLLDVPRYEFDWQNAYVLDEPKPMPEGTVMRCLARFDNSVDNPNNPDPSRLVTFGEQTNDEMLVGYMDVTLGYQDLSVPAPSATPRDDGNFDVTFRHRPPAGTKRVQLAGTFNKDFSPVQPLDGPGSDGLYTVTIPLPPGRYEYKYVQDGKNYRHDPANWRQAGFFNNSVLTVGKTP